jgi:hypothetical protein
MELSLVCRATSGHEIKKARREPDLSFDRVMGKNKYHLSYDFCGVLCSIPLWPPVEK